MDSLPIAFGKQQDQPREAQAQHGGHSGRGPRGNVGMGKRGRGRAQPEPAPVQQNRGVKRPREQREEGFYMPSFVENPWKDLE